MDKAERMRALRDAKSIGMLEAKAIVERQDLLEAIYGARDIDDIKAILLKIVR